MGKRFISIVSIIAISMSLVACGHEHTFKEATCTEPRTCTECGETEGEALGHTWKEADCENPKMCTICGQVEGEALGHTVDVGLCSRCNKIANEDLINEVMTYFGKASDASNNAVNEVNKADTSSLSNTYTHLSNADGYLSTVKENMQKVYDLCGEYTGLASIKSAAKAVLDVIPSKIAGSDSSSEVAWLMEYKTFLSTIGSSYTTIAEYASGLAKSSK